MKLYLHLEDGRIEFSWRWIGVPPAILESVLKGFSNAFHRKHPRLRLSNIRVQTAEKHEVALNTPVDTLTDGQDIYVVGDVQEETPSLGTDCNTSDNDAAMTQVLLEATQYMGKSNFRCARRLYEKLLCIQPNHREALFQLGNIYLAANRPRRALQYYANGTGAYPTDYRFWISSGEAHLQLGEPLEALKAFNSALPLLEHSEKSHSEIDRVKLLVGRALYAKGDTMLAMQLWTGLLQANEHQQEVLVDYGKGLLDMGNTIEALRVFLRAIVLDSNDKRVREMLAMTLQRPGALELLQQELTPAASSAPAYAFLAVAVKDYGAVEESVELYRLALSLRPNSATYLLNYVHTLEVVQRYREAYQATKQYLGAFPTLKVGELANHTVLSVVETVDDPATCSVLQGGWQGTPTAATSEHSAQAELTSDELDLLAVHFTLVKILFVVGAVQLIPPLAALIEPVRKGRSLHLTSIRNEHAYYCCITQLLPHLSAAPPLTAPMYVVGDSHCLAPAWHTLVVRNTSHVLIPRLVTGLKMWHLRPASKFFPKVNFFKAVETIPDGATIVFLFGEIDCREGLLICVEKCRYESIEEGAATTIDIYLEVLEKLVKQHGWTAYIHPVVPVLNETRHIVKIFNAILRTKLLHNPRLKWLDFFDELLDDTGGFNKKYELDGTHMNPSYLPLMAAAMARHQ